MSTLGKHSRTKSTNVASKLGRKRQQSSSYKVTFCSPKDATAILFVFGTRMVRRYILNIEVDSVAVNSKVVLDIGMVAKGVQSLLTGNRIPNGKIVEIGMIGGVRLLLWKFSETTACSNATASNFHGITAIDSIGVARGGHGRAVALPSLNFALPSKVSKPSFSTQQTS